MADTFAIQTIDHALALDGDEQRELSHGLPGTWLLYGATFVPATTLAEHADNWQKLELLKEDGGTSLGYMTNDTGDTYSAAYTKGTPRHMTLTGTGKNLEFTKDNCLEVAVNEDGTTAALDGSLTIVWKFLRM